MQNSIQFTEKFSQELRIGIICIHKIIKITVLWYQNGNISKIVLKSIVLRTENDIGTRDNIDWYVSLVFKNLTS